MPTPSSPYKLLAALAAILLAAPGQSHAEEGDSLAAQLRKALKENQKLQDLYQSDILFNPNTPSSFKLEYSRLQEDLLGDQEDVVNVLRAEEDRLMKPVNEKEQKYYYEKKKFIKKNWKKGASGMANGLEEAKWEMKHQSLPAFRTGKMSHSALTWDEFELEDMKEAKRHAKLRASSDFDKLKGNRLYKEMKQNEKSATKEINRIFSSLWKKGENPFSGRKAKQLDGRIKIYLKSLAKQKSMLLAAAGLTAAAVTAAKADAPATVAEQELQEFEEHSSPEADEVASESAVLD